MKLRLVSSEVAISHELPLEAVVDTLRHERAKFVGSEVVGPRGGRYRVLYAVPGWSCEIAAWAWRHSSISAHTIYTLRGWAKYLRPVHQVNHRPKAYR